MRFLSFSHGDGKEEVSAIIESKYEPCKNLLKGKYDSILARIDEFNAEKQLSIFPTPVHWDLDIKNCMTGMYKSKTVELQSVKSKIKAALRSIDKRLLCPYCGIAVADCHDHFLDKDTYPEYSVLLDNLIYVCDKCNTIKKQKGENSISNIIWSYHVLDDTHVFLQCDLKSILGIIVPEFSIVASHSEVPEEILYRIQRHFVELDLAERYFLQSQTEVAFFVEQYEQNLNNEEKRLNILYMYYDRARKFSAEYHPNHYHSVLCDALISQIPVLLSKELEKAGSDEV